MKNTKCVMVSLLLVLLIGVVSAQSNTYYYTGNTAVAVKDSQGEVTYLYQDRMGSDTQTKTLPFGQVVESGDRFGFTGKERDDSGLHYFAARYYDSSIGRFTSVDPVPSEPAYQYVGNNPLTYVDPSGTERRVGAQVVPGSQKMLRTGEYGQIIRLGNSDKYWSLLSPQAADLNIMKNLISDATHIGDFIEQAPNLLSIRVRKDLEGTTAGLFHGNSQISIKKGKIFFAMYHEIGHAVQDERGMFRLMSDLEMEYDAERFGATIKKELGFSLTEREAASLKSINDFEPYYRRDWLKDASMMNRIKGEALTTIHNVLSTPGGRALGGLGKAGLHMFPVIDIAASFAYSHIAIGELNNAMNNYQVDPAAVQSCIGCHTVMHADRTETSFEDYKQWEQTRTNR